MVSRTIAAPGAGMHAGAERQVLADTGPAGMILPRIRAGEHRRIPVRRGPPQADQLAGLNLDAA